MLELCFKLPSCLFGNTGDTSVMHEKTNFICFNYMQPQKVIFQFVQINMKQVSYRMLHRSCIKDFPCMLNSFKFHFSLLTFTL